MLTSDQIDLGRDQRPVLDQFTEIHQGRLADELALFSAPVFINPRRTEARVNSTSRSVPTLNRANIGCVTDSLAA